MSEMEYEVVRMHVGDKPYAPGDIRVGEERYLKPLVDKGILKPVKAAKDAPENKAAKDAPENKAAE